MASTSNDPRLVQGRAFDQPQFIDKHPLTAADWERVRAQRERTRKALLASAEFNRMT